MLPDFISVIHVHGLFERIRTSEGKMLVYGGTWQNNMVCQLLLLRAPRPIMNALSICGVIYTDVWPLFYNIVYSLEDDDKLDPNNEIDFYCLHYVYLPHISLAVQHFSHSQGYRTITHFL